MLIESKILNQNRYDLNVRTFQDLEIFKFKTVYKN